MHTIIIALALILASPAFAQSEVSGTCHVVDGDTVFAGLAEVRLQGVVAPEDPDEPDGMKSTQPFGQRSKSEFKKGLWSDSSSICFGGSGNVADSYSSLVCGFFAKKQG